MVGAFREPSCGRRTQPIHSIPYSVAQPLERGSNNYYSIIQGGETVKKKKKKPTKSRVDVRTIVITAIVDFLVGLALLLIDKHT